MLARFAELMYNVFDSIQLCLMRVFKIEQGDNK